MSADNEMRKCINAAFCDLQVDNAGYSSYLLWQMHRLLTLLLWNVRAHNTLQMKTTFLLA